MSAQRLVELVTVWADYADKYPDLKVDEFCRLYLESRETSTAPQPDPVQQNAEMSRLLGRLIKFVSLYGKKALEGEAVQNFDDLLYVGVTIFRQQPRKSEVIQEMMTAFPTGTEIIKRLIRQGFLEEFADPVDGRSKRLKATSAGTRMWFDFLPKLQKIGHIAFDYLDPVEKKLLHRLLAKLELFHSEQEKKLFQSDFEGIFQALSPKLK